MRATVVVQDRTVWLSGGGPLLCVLSVSGAVRKRRSPDPTGHNKLDAGDARGGNGRSVGEEAEGTAGHGRNIAGGGGDAKRYGNDGRDVGRDEDDGATGPRRRQTTDTAKAGRGGRQDGGGGVVARSTDVGRDVRRRDDAEATAVGPDHKIAKGEGDGESAGGRRGPSRPRDGGDAEEAEGSGGTGEGGRDATKRRDDGRDVATADVDGKRTDDDDDAGDDDDDDEPDGTEEGREGSADRRRRGGAGGCARVLPDPGGLTSPGGLRGLGSPEPGHTPRRRNRGGRALARVVA